MLVWTLGVALWLAEAAAYLGPPYLYVTFHGGSSTGDHNVNTIYKYSRDGYLLGEVLVRNETSEELRELRGMYISEKNHLHVLNAYAGDSKILEFSACDEQGMRHFRRVDIRYNDESNPAMIHPYSIDRRSNGLMENDTVYVSAQDSSTVLRFATKDFDGSSQGNAWHPEPASQNVISKGKAVPGAFVKHDSKDAQIRGIALGTTRDHWLFVADRNSDSVTVYDKEGFKTESISVTDPISIVAGGGVVRLQNTSLMLVGSAEAGDGKVILLDQLTSKTIATYRAGDLLQHPAGITVHDDELFVCSQSTGAIIVFNFTSTEVLRVIVTSLPDQPEHLVLSPC